MKLLHRYRGRPQEETSCKVQPEEEIQKWEKQPPFSQRLLSCSKRYTSNEPKSTSTVNLLSHSVDLTMTWVRGSVWLQGQSPQFLLRAHTVGVSVKLNPSGQHLGWDTGYQDGVWCREGERLCTRKSWDVKVEQLHIQLQDIPCTWIRTRRGMLKCRGEERIQNCWYPLIALQPALTR